MYVITKLIRSECDDPLAFFHLRPFCSKHCQLSSVQILCCPFILIGYTMRFPIANSPKRSKSWKPRKCGEFASSTVDHPRNSSKHFSASVFSRAAMMVWAVERPSPASQQQKGHAVQRSGDMRQLSCQGQQFHVQHLLQGHGAKGQKHQKKSWGMSPNVGIAMS